ncbi:hypothetical protein [Solidesulfovibrio sp. C21]|uniref:hypothetical protein n=1 Tax=Solidesulfovibrio sp. C21 TaxID=3398613 RepID=UPI0039FD0829
MDLQSCHMIQKLEVAKDARQGVAYVLTIHTPIIVLLLFMLLLTGARGALATQSLQGHNAAGISVSSKTDTYDWYTNHKYGYVIAWPKKLLTALGESDAGDGQIFKDADGQAELICWAGWNSVGTNSIKVLYIKAQQEIGSRVTYKYMGKNFFVVSGIKDGKIVYQKTIKNKVITATFILTYPKSSSAVFNPLVGDIAKSFVASSDFMAR